MSIHLALPEILIANHFLIVAPNDRDRERVVKNVSARVIEVTAKDVVLCFQLEGGDKEPIRLQNDIELDITLCGRKSPEV